MRVLRSKKQLVKIQERTTLPGLLELSPRVLLGDFPLTLEMSVQTVVVHPRSKCLSSFTHSGSKHDCIIPASRPVRLDIHKIRQQSHHSQVVAAMHLGISLTALKVACRQLGVVSWISLREQSSDTQPAAPSATGGQGAPDDAAQSPQPPVVKDEIDAKDVHEPEDCLKVINVKAGISNMTIGEAIKQGQANSHHQTPDVAACKQSHAVGCTLSSLSQHPAGPTSSMVPQGHVHDQELCWQATTLGWQPTELGWEPTMSSMMRPCTTPGVQPPFLSPPCANDHSPGLWQPPSMVPQGHVHDQDQGLQATTLGWQPAELGWETTMMSTRATPGVQPPFLSLPCANDHGPGLWQPPSRCRHNGGPHCPVSIARSLGLRFDLWRGEWVIDDCAAAAGTHTHTHTHTHTYAHPRTHTRKHTRTRTRTRPVSDGGSRIDH